MSINSIPVSVRGVSGDLGALADTSPGEPRSVDTLLELLDRIDRESWDGPTGTALLDYVRETIVRPLVIELGVRGGAADQAESSAWQDVWHALTLPALREAASPWGFLWHTARRAVLTEVVCAQYPTSPSRAWRLATAPDCTRFAPVAPLPDDERLLTSASDVGLAHPTERPAAMAAAAALVAAGWDVDTARSVVIEVLCDEPTARTNRWAVQRQSSGYGWRTMATRLGLPAWQARRLVLVLRGTPERPGLIPRLIRAGGALPLDREMQRALASTVRRSYGSPVLPRVDDAANEARAAG